MVYIMSLNERIRRNTLFNIKYFIIQNLKGLCILLSKRRIMIWLEAGGVFNTIIVVYIIHFSVLESHKKS